MTITFIRASLSYLPNLISSHHIYNTVRNVFRIDPGNIFLWQVQYSRYNLYPSVIKVASCADRFTQIPECCLQFWRLILTVKWPQLSAHVPLLTWSSTSTASLWKYICFGTQALLPRCYSHYFNHNRKFTQILLGKENVEILRTGLLLRIMMIPWRVVIPCWKGLVLPTSTTW